MSPRQIKRIRKTLGLTQQAMADIIGCRQHTVARWETEEMEPRGANLKALRELAEKVHRIGIEAARPVEEEPALGVVGQQMAWGLLAPGKRPPPDGALGIDLLPGPVQSILQRLRGHQLGLKDYVRAVIARQVFVQ